MKENLTEIVFILDRSGSMAPLEADTIGGFNSFVEKQKLLDGEARMTTILFDDTRTILHNAVDIKELPPLTNKEYYARGTTALYDAVGEAIDNVGKRLSSTPEEERPSKVIFCITTDGYENASRYYSREKIKEMIQHQTDKYSWEFVFLGANIDAEEVGESMGFAPQCAVNYTATATGTKSVYASLDAAVSSVRSTGSLAFNWAETVE